MSVTEPGDHKARIKRTKTGVSCPLFRYSLYVDGYMILEHCQRPTYEAGAMGHGPYYVDDDEESKKTK